MSTADIQPPAEAAGSITIAILGCGKLSIAILHGLLSNSDPDPTFPYISRVVATVRTAASAKRIQQSLQDVLPSKSTTNAHPRSQELLVLLQEGNARAAAEADIVILGCKPYSFEEVLGKSDVQHALLQSARKKILVSLLGGVTVAQLERCLCGSDSPTGFTADTVSQRCQIVRVCPSLAARVQRSMTVLALPKSKAREISNAGETEVESRDTQSLPAEHALIGKLFDRVGATQWLHESLMNLGASLCASSPAIFATVIEAMAASADAFSVDGYGGITKDVALRMVTQAARGTADMILAGDDPEHIRREVATEGGSTRQGLNTFVRLQVSDALGAVMADVISATAGLSVRK